MWEVHGCADLVHEQILVYVQPFYQKVGLSSACVENRIVFCRFLPVPVCMVGAQVSHQEAISKSVMLGEESRPFPFGQCIHINYLH